MTSLIPPSPSLVMYLIAIYWGFILLSLLITFFHPPHAKDPIANQTLLSPAIPPADKLEVDVRSAALSLDFGSPVREAHISYLQTPSSQWAGLRDKWQTAGVALAIILLASIVWLLWERLGVDVQNGTENLSTNRGCTEAVSGPSVDSPLPNDPTKPQTRRERPASVVSADSPPYHVLQSNEYIVVTTPPAVTPRSNTFRKFVVAVCCLLPTWTWFRINQSEPAVVCLSIRPRGSLQRSLHKGSRDLSESFLEPGRCIFLVVGVDTWGHLDAENDTEYLRQMFESAGCGSSLHRYECLYGPGATFENIRATVFALLDGARAALGPSQLFILFTGTGDSDNAMCLPNDRVLSDSDLKTWFSTSSAGQTNDFNIGVLFDICRSAVSHLATVFQPIELAWSCSVGEFAYAICISEDKLIPRSIFLLAVFLAAHDMKVHDLDDCCFEAAFGFHIKQLSDLILFMYRRDHWGECSRCLTHERCEAPVAQTPDLQQAGRVVASLGTLIATHFPQHASEVFAAVDQKMLQEKFPGRLCPLSVFHAQQSNKPTVKDES